MSRFINDFERHELDQLAVQTRLNQVIGELLLVVERRDLDTQLQKIADPELYEEWRRVNEYR
jgi:hypothetical protein